MTDFDVFNGDADGMCSLHQLRLSDPRNALLVTGVKRDISLLDKVNAKDGDRVTVLDISMNKNSAALLRLLDAGANVVYFDHHLADNIPQHGNLTAHIHTAAEVCTSLIVNGYLQGSNLIWAVIGAFGDNLTETARRTAISLKHTESELCELQELGEYLNYNSYGESVEDLFFRPEILYRELHRYTDPFKFMRESEICQTLRRGYIADLSQARSVRPIQTNSIGTVYLLPDAPWARRVSGVFSNAIANASPRKAHAVLTEKPEGYSISVRAPLCNKRGADTLCVQFDSGGGRKSAAGINRLSREELPRFLRMFDATFRAVLAI